MQRFSREGKRYLQFMHGRFILHGVSALLFRHVLLHHISMHAVGFDLVPTISMGQNGHLCAGAPLGHLGAVAFGGIAHVDGGTAARVAFVAENALGGAFAIAVEFQARSFDISHRAFIIDAGIAIADGQHRYNGACFTDKEIDAKELCQLFQNYAVN